MASYGRDTNKRLNDAQVREIRHQRWRGDTLKQIGARFNRSEAAISRIVNGHSYGPAEAR